MRLAWQGLAFDVCDGTHIAVADAAATSRDELAQFVAGPVMGALLTQRGFYVLHASAVRLDGEVVAFTARSGVGKSTLAIQLARCGAEHLADDMVVLAADAAGVTVVMGPRLAKVSVGAVVAGDEVVSRERLAGRCLVRVPPGGRDDGSRQRLARLCVLTDASDEGVVTITRMLGARRFVAVADADFGARVLGADAGAATLERTRGVARAVVVESLARPRRLDVGPAVVRALRATATAPQPVAPQPPAWV